MFHRVPVLGESRGPALCKCCVHRLKTAPACSQAGPPRAQAHTCTRGLPDRPEDPYPSEVNDNWALEAGACQEPLSLNEGLFTC